MRGGSGRGQGRKRGGRNKRKQAELDKAAAGGELPLDYALRIMRDPKTTKARADRFCVLALPFCHAKLAPKEEEGKKPGGDKGKKAAAKAAAQTAGAGTQWGSDLEPPAGATRNN